MILSSPGAYISDRDVERTARALAMAAFTVSNAVILLYMAMIQYLLVKIHFSKSKIKPPTTSETYTVVTALWVGHRVFDSILATVIDVIMEAFSGEAVEIQYRHFRLATYNIRYWIHDDVLPLPNPWWDKFSLLYYEISATWVISQGLFLVFDKVLPFLQDAQDIRPRINRIRKRFRLRCRELMVFMQRLRQKKAARVSVKRARIRKAECQDGDSLFGQSIQLQRHHREILDKGQRTLNWDLAVDKRALDEMMETLGPPGGFGELGFNVAKDRVCFGAMGVRTQFNLTFVLDLEKCEDFQVKS